MPLQFFIFQQIFNSTCQDPTFLFSRHSFEFLSIFLTKSNVQLLALGKEAELNIAFWAQKPFAEIRHLQTRNLSLLYNIFIKNVGILQENVKIYSENVLLSQYIDFKRKIVESPTVHSFTFFVSEPNCQMALPCAQSLFFLILRYL